MTPDSSFRIAHFSELDNLTLYAILQLRTQVYIVEQEWLYQDMDDHDLSAYHIFWIQDERICGTCRYYESQGRIWLGRVILLPDFRRQGIGTRMMQFALAQIDLNFPGSSVHLISPAHLEKFYEIQGFKKTGEENHDYGVPYYEMVNLNQGK